MQIPSERDDAVDPGGAQRRLKLQLHSRMMTDLMVLTGGKRLPSDDEIHTELRRAARAYGVWTPQLETAWRNRPGNVQPGLQFASYETPDDVAAGSIASAARQGPVSDAAVAQVPVEPETNAGFAGFRDLPRNQRQDLSLQAAGWRASVNDPHATGDPQRTDGQPGAVVPEFTVPANQTARRMNGTAPVGDYIRGKIGPTEQNAAIRLSEVNAWLKAATVQNAANLAIEQARRKFPLATGPGPDPTSSPTYSYDKARTGYELASLAASSRALVTANPDSPESDKNHLLEFADRLERASTEMAGGRWIGANPIADAFSYNGIDYPDFGPANQARLHNQSAQPSVSALTPEMIEEREKVALDQEVLADRNDALPSAVERTYFTARAQGASLAELKQVIARGQFMDATLGAAGAITAAGTAKGGPTQIRPYSGFIVDERAVQQHGAPAGSVKHVNPLKSQYNCTNCALAVDHQLATGARTSALPMEEALPYAEMNSRFNTVFSSWTTRSAIERSLLSRGDGTRAITYGMTRSGRRGHVWNAVVQNGRINYIDGQIGRGGKENFENFPYLTIGIINGGKK